MILNKQILSSRKHQVIVLTFLINLFLVTSVILPDLDKIPYFKTKIEKLGQSKLLFENYNLHIKYYETRRESVSKELDRIRKEVEEHATPSFFPDYFEKIRATFDIELVSQKFETTRNDPEFLHINIYLSVSGSYSDLSNYLDAIHNASEHIIFESITFSNKEPLAENPTIHLDLSLKCIVLQNI